MALTQEVKAFMRGCKVRLDEMETTLAEAYDKIATSDKRNQLTVVNMRASKARKAEYMVLYAILWRAPYKDRSQLGDLLDLFRRLSQDPDYAAQLFATSDKATIDDITARGKAPKTAPSPKRRK